jgi:hypothetical protein
MDGRRDPFQRICERVYDRFAERKSVFGSERLISMFHQSAFTSTIKRVLFLPSVDAYDGPHSMVVRIQIDTDRFKLKIAKGQFFVDGFIKPAAAPGRRNSSFTSLCRRAQFCELKDFAPSAAFQRQSISS